MCGVGTAVLVAGSARVGRGRALSLCSPCAATAHAGLSSGFVVATLGFDLKLGAGLVAVKTPVFFWKLARIDIFDHTL